MFLTRFQNKIQKVPLLSCYWLETYLNPLFLIYVNYFYFWFLLKPTSIIIVAHIDLVLGFSWREFFLGF